MPEARRLKSGKWRLYQTPDLYPIRDPANGTILAFQSLAEARQWWSDRPPQGRGLGESCQLGALIGLPSAAEPGKGERHQSSPHHVMAGENRIDALQKLLRPCILGEKSCRAAVQGCDQRLLIFDVPEEHDPGALL